jgi:hypothetical protein
MRVRLVNIKVIPIKKRLPNGDRINVGKIKTNKLILVGRLEKLWNL